MSVYYLENYYYGGGWTRWTYDIYNDKQADQECKRVCREGEILMEWEQSVVWEVDACMEDARFCHLKLGEWCRGVWWEKKTHLILFQSISHVFLLFIYLFILKFNSIFCLPWWRPHLLAKFVFRGPDLLCIPYLWFVKKKNIMPNDKWKGLNRIEWTEELQTLIDVYSQIAIHLFYSQLHFLNLHCECNIILNPFCSILGQF